MERIKEKINGTIWPIILTALLTTNGFFLGSLLIKMDRIYDTVIENKIKVESNNKRLDRIEKMLIKEINEN